MTAFTVIAQKALGKIGVHSVLSPADEESITTAMDTMNSLLEEWEDIGIDTGMVPLKTPGQELSEPAAIRNALYAVLAFEMAPQFSSGQAVVTPELVAAKNRGMRAIRRYQNIVPPAKVVSSTMPLGAGNMKGTRPRVFAGRNHTLAPD